MQCESQRRKQLKWVNWVQGTTRGFGQDTVRSRALESGAYIEICYPSLVSSCPQEMFLCYPPTNYSVIPMEASFSLQ